MSDQLSLIERRTDYPAPKGWAPYSCMVVWRTCLAMELNEWLRQRKGTI